MAFAPGIAQAGARSQRAWIEAAAGAVVLLASLLNFLNHNKYPLFSAEVGLVVLALLAASLVAAQARTRGRIRLTAKGDCYLNTSPADRRRWMRRFGRRIARV